MPLLVGHVAWATATIFKLRQTIYGEDGTNGLKKRITELEYALSHAPPDEHPWMTRARHNASNVAAGPIGELDEQIMDLKGRVQELERRKPR